MKLTDEERTLIANALRDRNTQNPRKDALQSREYGIIVDLIDRLRRDA